MVRNVWLFLSTRQWETETTALLLIDSCTKLLACARSEVFYFSTFSEMLRMKWKVSPCRTTVAVDVTVEFVCNQGAVSCAVLAYGAPCSCYGNAKNASHWPTRSFFLGIDSVRAWRFRPEPPDLTLPSQSQSKTDSVDTLSHQWAASLRQQMRREARLCSEEDTVPISFQIQAKNKNSREINEFQFNLISHLYMCKLEWFPRYNNILYIFPITCPSVALF